MNENYQLGLFYLIHLLASSDGDIDESELKAMQFIKKIENIPDEVYKKFTAIIQTKGEREIFETGMNFLDQCSREEKLRAFALIYKLSDVDGRVHVKEVRLLLYATKMTGIDFDAVIAQANQLPVL
jgi:hypothetical protein